MYLNGVFLPRSQARLDIEDRGSMFADGVYEVIAYHHGRPLAMREHSDRLRASLQAIELSAPPQVDQLGPISDELVRRNGLENAKVYWQITRGSAPRDHAFPPPDTPPTVFAIAYPMAALDRRSEPAKLRAILVEDIRWHRCSIKSLLLLPNALAKNQAKKAGADEAILHRGPTVTEGTATSVFIVRDNQLWTHPADQWILDGITRRLVLRLAHETGVPAFERTFTTQQLLTADEVLICGTTTPVAGVVQIDQHTLHDGQIGPTTRKLHDALVAYIFQTCGG